MQASGHRFDPDRLHHLLRKWSFDLGPPHKRRRPFGLANLRFVGAPIKRSATDTLVDEDSGLPAKAGDMARSAGLFDIVNGFFNRCRGDMGLVFWCLPQGEQRKVDQMLYTQDYLAEFNNHTDTANGKCYPVLSLVVWTLKREVRASGECLGMYRR